MNANYIVCVLLAIAACGPAQTTAPTQQTPPTEIRNTPSACREGRVVPCPCKQGKGYRMCASGRLGECVCRRLGNKGADDPARTAKSKDPFAAPTDVKTPPATAIRTRSGLAYRVLRSGSGTTKPTPTGRVTVHYSGWTTDGKLFDSSHRRGRPATFRLNRLIAGWTEGLQLMSAGDKYRFWIPQRMAYKGLMGRPRGMLVFDVEMISVH